MGSLSTGLGLTVVAALKLRGLCFLKPNFSISGVSVNSW